MDVLTLLVWILIASLANYKAAHMLSQTGDDGPFDAFKFYRSWMDGVFGVESWVSRGAHCFSCTSFWGALIASLLVGAALPFNLFLLVWGAIATLSYIVWRYFG